MRYFDYNATAPLSARARQVWLEAHDRFVANPASQHRLGQRADKALEDAREAFADLLGARSGELVWTSGATESANTVIAHLQSMAGNTQSIWISAIEHPCVLEAAEHWFPGRVIRLDVSSSGVLDLARFEERLNTDPTPAAVALMAANNETGILQPWKETSNLCRARGIPFLCDATQWLGRLSSEGLGDCDFLIGSAHKFGGPVGTGFLKTDSSSRFQPLLFGGAQEEGRRAGTQNVAGVLASIAAFQECQARLPEIPSRFEIQAHFEARVVAELGAIVLGASVPRLWNTVSVVLPELTDCRQRWVVRLDAAGVAASTGSACASGQEKTSHVLDAMGISAEAAGRTLRFSAGWETTFGDWDAVAGVLGEIWGRWGQKSDFDPQKR